MLDLADFFWGILVALGGAVWVVTVFVRDRNAAGTELTSSLIRRIHEMDRTVIEHPDVQKYLALNAGREEAWFRTPEVLQDDRYYKAKSLAYWHLNLFDEIICNAAASASGPALLAPRVAEFADWEAYVRHKLRHPLYRSILAHEEHIFGTALRDFWNRHRNEATPPDPYSW